MCAQPSRSEIQRMSSPPFTTWNGFDSTQVGNESRATCVDVPVLGSTERIDIRLYPRAEVMTNRRSQFLLQRGLGLKLIDGEGASFMRTLVWSMMSMMFTSAR